MHPPEVRIRGHEFRRPRHRHCESIAAGDEVAGLIEPLGLEIAIETKVDNDGLKIVFEEE